VRSRAAAPACALLGSLRKRTVRRGRDSPLRRC